MAFNYCFPMSNVQFMLCAQHCTITQLERQENTGQNGLVAALAVTYPVFLQHIKPDLKYITSYNFCSKSDKICFAMYHSSRTGESVKSLQAIAWQQYRSSYQKKEGYKDVQLTIPLFSFTRFLDGGLHGIPHGIRFFSTVLWLPWVKHPNSNYYFLLFSNYSISRLQALLETNNSKKFLESWMRFI